MAIHWQIPFVSLRTHTQYTVNVYDTTYSGAPVLLNGGADPITTDEDGDDDPFAPIITQSGKLRIIDDGFAADGVTPFDWKQFVPSLAAERPVTLTHMVNGTAVVDWQGFMQTQDFSGTLFDVPQEREFPLCCPLSVLKSQQPSTADPQRHNFAYVIDLMAAATEALSVQVIGFDTFIIQGNHDAQQWLHKKFEWMNVLAENNNENEDDIVPQYNLYEILEDVCKFWGWTCRTQGRTMYLTCYDDVTEPNWVSMTRAELRQMVQGTVAGTNDVEFVPVTLSGDIFASDDNDDFKRRGPGKAVVQANCNKQDTIIEFAPPSVQKLMDQGGYTWVAGEESGTGYYTTTPINSFDSLTLAGSSTTNGGYCRRQIFSDAEAEKATLEDMFVFKNGYRFGYNIIKIQTKKAMNFVGGTLKISGDVYRGVKKWNDEDSDIDDYVQLCIGIGMTHATAKWYYIEMTDTSITYGWRTEPYSLLATVRGGSFKGIGSLFPLSFLTLPVVFDGVPCNDSSLYGYVFVDIQGFKYDLTHTLSQFEIGNFKISFSREEIFIPTTPSHTRPRTMNKDRVSSMDYLAGNGNGSGEEWNADCIYASDNNMEYGYGLVMNPEGTFMETARYGHDITDPDIHNKVEHPEQHLADRVAAFWQSSKRQITAELRSDMIPLITPQHRVTMVGFVFNPVAISRNWCDDVTTITLLQDYTQYNTPST